MWRSTSELGSRNIALDGLVKFDFPLIHNREFVRLRRAHDEATDSAEAVNTHADRHLGLRVAGSWRGRRGVSGDLYLNRRRKVAFALEQQCAPRCHCTASAFRKFKTQAQRGNFRRQRSSATQLYAVF